MMPEYPNARLPYCLQETSNNFALVNYFPRFWPDCRVYMLQRRKIAEMCNEDVQESIKISERKVACIAHARLRFAEDDPPLLLLLLFPVR